MMRCLNGGILGPRLPSGMRTGDRKRETLSTRMREKKNDWVYEGKKHKPQKKEEEFLFGVKGEIIQN